ncbi:MAG: ADP-ribosylglycohydrolase family protein [Erysipelotrichales bacterium]|nr:ADP-ribosylglycohydrolase family protein [Erysipelotrichales bacterium]
MLGAIIGDVAGSIYEVLEVNYKKEHQEHRPYEERIKILSQDTPLFTDECSYTDDTVLTLALYDAIKNGNKDYEKYLREYGNKEVSLGMDKYGRSRFGKGFVGWLNGDEGNSLGNGAAMRISPVGYLFDNIDTIKRESKNATIPSHNHIDSIKAAECISTSIYLLRNGYNKEKLKEYIENNYYKLDYDLEDLQRNYTFSSKCIDSVPQSLFVFLKSESFEDAIRKALSIGGDADTIAAIVGSLAESLYGIPDEIIINVKKYLTDEQLALLGTYYENML